MSKLEALLMVTVCAVGALVACKAEPQTSAPAEVAPVAVQANGTTATHIVSYAMFAGDRLSWCSDVTAFLLPSEDHLREEMASKARGDGVVRLNKLCEQEFAHRPMLGRCSIKTKSVNVTSWHYSAATVIDSDSSMRDCLAGGGDWQPSDPSRRLRHLAGN